MDATIVSVIMSGVVAVAGILITPLMNLITERAKWSQERKAAEIESIDNSTIELLEKLAIFRAGRLQTQEYIYLLGKYYAWERAVWPHCKDAEHKQVINLRAKFESKALQTLHDEEPDLADKILELAHIASKRVK